MSLSMRKVDPAWLTTSVDGTQLTATALDWMHSACVESEKFRAATTDEERDAIKKQAQKDWLKTRRKLIKEALKDGRVKAGESKLYKKKASKAKKVEVKTEPVPEPEPVVEPLPVADPTLLADDPPRKLKITVRKPVDAEGVSRPAKKSRWTVPDVYVLPPTGDANN